VSVYLDASALVPLFTADLFTARTDEFLRTKLPLLVVSDFAAAEFASAIARRVRVGDLTEDEARGAFRALDDWVARKARRAETTAKDVAAAAALLRRLDLRLRTPDAVNIAIVRRIGADLLTYDEKMATCARMLGLMVLPA
jgi:predicted nucleic acid-binding protein